MTFRQKPLWGPAFEQWGRPLRIYIVGRACAEVQSGAVNV